jgi:hypothetical protein
MPTLAEEGMFSTSHRDTRVISRAFFLWQFARAAFTLFDPLRERTSKSSSYILWLWCLSGSIKYRKICSLKLDEQQSSFCPCPCIWEHRTRAINDPPLAVVHEYCRGRDDIIILIKARTASKHERCCQRARVARSTLSVA